ncbi:MAG: uroporphyrinogen decarboxylase family protein [Anaerolineae bacterium]|jgi:uroporphyrinogen decarboxylase
MNGPDLQYLASNPQSPDFGRVRRAMRRQAEGDRVPLFEMSVHGSHKAAILGRPLRGLQDEVDFWRVAGYDFVSIRAGVRSVVRGYHPAVRAWHTARGKARGSGGWVAEDAALVRDRREFDAFPWPSPEELGGYPDYDNLDEYLHTIAPLLPAGMKLLVQIGYVFMGAWQLLGFENYCLKLADDPGLIRDVHDWLGSSQLAVLETLLRHECVGTVWLPDDLCYNSGPMVAPRVYREYVYPWYVKIVDRCHEAQIPVGLHSDGDLSRLLPGLVDCGFDAIHPFEPPMNNIVAVKREWGHCIAVAGGIDLKGALCDGTPADVEAEVRTQVAALAPGGGWLLGSSNSIPDFVPVENYRALLAAGLEYGKYA